jgi:hypothetical protein
MTDPAQSNLFTSSSVTQTPPEKAMKIKNDIMRLTDKHWDTGLLPEHRSIILAQELKAKGYTKEDFENIQIPADIQDKYDYDFLLQDVLFYFGSKPIAVENAHEIFYNQRIIPNIIGSLYFINSSLRKQPAEGYGRLFSEKWRFFHGKNADEAMRKLGLYLDAYSPRGDFDRLVYGFYRQFSPFFNNGTPVRDSDGVTAVQGYIKSVFDEAVREIKSKKNGRINEKNIMHKMKDNFSPEFFLRAPPETKMILGGHYRNEMPGGYAGSDYRKLLLNLFELIEDMKQKTPDKTVKEAITNLRKNLRFKYHSALLPEERKYDG